MADFGREPDPNWRELDDKAKIERLRDEVLEQNRLLGRMADYLNKLVGHDHISGKMVQVQPLIEPEPDFRKIDGTDYSTKENFVHYKLKDNWLY